MKSWSAMGKAGGLDEEVRGIERDDQYASYIGYAHSQRHPP